VRRPRHGSGRADGGRSHARVRDPRRPQRTTRRQQRDYDDSAEADESHIPSTTTRTADPSSTTHHPTKRVRPTPKSPFVREEETLRRRTDLSPPSPLRPVHSTAERQRPGRARRKPADFAQPDHTRPGRNTRFENDVAFSHLYGAYDDQMHAPFEGA
jgi:hypothetical protein